MMTEAFIVLVKMATLYCMTENAAKVSNKLERSAHGMRLGYQ